MTPATARMPRAYERQSGENDTCKGDEPEWWCPRYRNRGELADFMGDTQVEWVECVAVDFAQWLNGGKRSKRFDWTHESCVTTFLREIGPGVRVGYFVTAFIIVVVASFVLDEPPLFRYTIHHGSIETKYSDITYGFAFGLWMLDFAILCISYYLIRHAATPAKPCSNGEWIIFQRIPTLTTREMRAQEPLTFYTRLVRVFAFVFYALYFVLGVLATHTLISHMAQNRNPYIALLLLIQALLALLASLDDLTNLGSPWGIQECSKFASVMLSVRGLYLVPVTLVWTACAVAAAFPPSYCREC